MEPSKLPGRAADIYREIRKRHKVAFEPLKVRGRELQLLQITDLEPLLAGKDPFKNVSDFPFWVKPWEAALALTDLMASLPPAPGKRLLELGAGLGAPGLMAALNGYQVTLSDYEALILDFQRVSAAANGLRGVEFKLIDWKKPPELERFDVLIGAEVLFREEFFEPLLAVFAKYLASDGTIYLAHDIRRKSLPAFLKLAEQYYEIAVSTRKLTSDEETLTIVINRLRPRNPAAGN